MQEAVLLTQDLGAVQRILKAGFDVNGAIGCGTYSALDGAVQVQNVAMVNFLLDAGARPTGNALLSAARCPNAEISVKLVEALLNKGADVNFKEYYMGDSKRFSMPLHAACYQGNLQVVELLLRYPGIELNAIDIDGRTPLMWAVERGHEAIIAFLLEKGADPTVKNQESKTAADVAREQIKKRERILEMIDPSKRGIEPAGTGDAAERAR
jgi:ankyrin repeat protein